jgi:hypothetical protein
LVKALVVVVVVFKLQVVHVLFIRIFELEQHIHHFQQILVLELEVEHIVVDCNYCIDFDYNILVDYFDSYFFYNLYDVVALGYFVELEHFVGHLILVAEFDSFYCNFYIVFDILLVVLVDLVVLVVLVDFDNFVLVDNLVFSFVLVVEFVLIDLGFVLVDYCYIYFDNYFLVDNYFGNLDYSDVVDVVLLIVEYIVADTLIVVVPSFVLPLSIVVILSDCNNMLHNIFYIKFQIHCIFSPKFNVLLLHQHNPVDKI